MKRHLLIVALLTVAACDEGAMQNKTTGSGRSTAAKATVGASADKKPDAPATAKPDSQKTALDVAIGSPDHTTLVAAVKAADLVEVVGSPGGVYTIFAPTNAAFDKLPAGTVDNLMKPENKADLRKIVQHHAGVPIVQQKDMKEGATMSMSDGTKVTFHEKDGKYMVDNANIVAAIQATNGMVYVVDAVLLPPAK
ncbi:MAG: fasciclin domain-containing protein [Myxococcales bacterium]|nr:fasciclin domain-containing protein [Myxococcales bacterium]